MKDDFSPEKVTRDVDLLTSHDHDFVTFQQDLSNDCGQAAEQMATAIDYYGLEHKHSHWLETAVDVPYNLKMNTLFLIQTVLKHKMWNWEVGIP